MDDIRVHALIFAGGAGVRLGDTPRPKQFLELAGRPIVAHVLDHFETHDMVGDIVVVCLEPWMAFLEDIVEENHFEKITTIVPGGSTGQQSIYNGVLAIEAKRPADDAIVLVHDGVRPLIDADTITRCILSVAERGCTATVSPAQETIIEEENGSVARIVNRSRCKMARAPQGFRFAEFAEAHHRAQDEGLMDFVDSISLMSHYGHEIFVVEGPDDNIKITTKRDFFAFKGYVDYKEMGQLWIP